MKIVKMLYFNKIIQYFCILSTNDDCFVMPYNDGKKNIKHNLYHWDFSFLKKDYEEVKECFENGIISRFNILRASLYTPEYKDYRLQVIFKDYEKDLVNFIDYMIREKRLLKRLKNGKSVNYEGALSTKTSYKFIDIKSYYDLDSDEIKSEYRNMIGTKDVANQLISVDFISESAWHYYLSDIHKEYDKDKVGKWMYFISSSNDAYKNDDEEDYVNSIVRNAVALGVTDEAKCTSFFYFERSIHDTRVCIFYNEIDDIPGHKRIIQYMLDNKLIQRTKAGKLYNISFKLDNQTRSNEYGEDFKAELRLSDLMNLETEEWIV